MRLVNSLLYMEKYQSWGAGGPFDFIYAIYTQQTPLETVQF